MRVFVDGQGVLETDLGLETRPCRRARDRRQLTSKLAIADLMREWICLAPPGAEGAPGYDEMAAAMRIMVCPALATERSDDGGGGVLKRSLEYGGFIDDQADRDDLYWNLAPLSLKHVFPGPLANPHVAVTLDDCGPWARPQRLGAGVAATDLRAHRARLQMVASSADAVVYSSAAAEAEGSVALPPGLRGAQATPFWGQFDAGYEPVADGVDPTGLGPYVLLIGDGLDDERYLELAQHCVTALKQRAPMQFAALTPTGRLATPNAIMRGDVHVRDEPRVLDLERAMWVRRAQMVIVGGDDLMLSSRAALEALSCGRPVLIPDRPAPREAAGAHAALFDPAAPQSLNGAIEQALRDDSVAARASRIAAASKRRGPDPAGPYRLLIDEASRPPISLAEPPRIAILGPWPPQRTPIASYVRAMAEALRPYGRVEVYAEGEPAALAPAPDGVRLAPIADFPGAAEFDRVFAHLANSPIHHARSFAIAYEARGVELIVHESRLHPLARALHETQIAPAIYLHALEHLYSKHFIERHRRDRFAALPVSEGVLLGGLAYSARRIIVHSKAAAAEIEAERANGKGETPEDAAPIYVAPHPVVAPAGPPEAPRDPTAFVVGLMIDDPGGLGAPIGALALAATRRLGKIGLPVRLRVFRPEQARNEEDSASSGDVSVKDADLRGLSVELVAARYDAEASPEMAERLTGCDLWLSLSAPAGGVDSGLMLGLQTGLPCLVAGAAEALTPARGLARRLELPEDATAAAETLAQGVADLLLSHAQRRNLALLAAEHAAAHHSWRGFAETIVRDA